MVLKNVSPADQLRGLASRKNKPDEYKSVRHALADEEIAKGGWLFTRKNKTSTRLRRPKSHDRLLEDRIWTLMHRMGFRFLSGQGGAFQLLNEDSPEGPDNQIDVVALDDEVAFAVECKSTTKPKKFSDFAADLAKHVSLRDGFTRAIRAQFATEAKRPSVFVFWTAGMIFTENDRTRDLPRDLRTICYLRMAPGLVES